tara:strand:+ start:434 stop:2047 length:1614 start_codon:yes stop_codon:yes gene_type:complete
MFSLAILLPYTNFLVFGNFENSQFENIQRIVEFVLDDNLNLLSFTIVIFLVFLFKNIFFGASIYKVISSVVDIQQNIAQKLFLNYSTKSLKFYKNTNTSSILRNLTLDLTNFTNGLSSFLSLITEIMFIISICLLLFIANFQVTLFLIVLFGVCSFLFYFFTNKKLKKIGRERVIFDAKKIKNINQTFNGIFDIRINGSLIPFIDSFTQIVRKLRNLLGTYQFFLQTPKIYIEIVTVSSFLVLIIIFSIMENNNQVIGYLPLIGLYAASAFKLMPSFNRMLVQFQNLNYSSEVFKNYFNFLKITKKVKKVDFNSKKFVNFYKLNIQNLHFKYGEKPLFSNLNYQFKKGYVYGISGKSGVGKSTLINLILGLYQPYKGKISLDNKYEIKKLHSKWHQILSYVPQKPFFFDETIFTNITFSGFKDKEKLKKVNECLRFVNLNKKIKSLKNGLSTIIGEGGAKFSGGELQRLSIARSLYKKCEIIILDEATNSLDMKNQNIIMKNLKKLSHNKLIILVSHEKNILKKCDYIFDLSKIKKY